MKFGDSGSAVSMFAGYYNNNYLLFWFIVLNIRNYIHFLSECLTCIGIDAIINAQLSKEHLLLKLCINYCINSYKSKVFWQEMYVVSYFQHTGPKYLIVIVLIVCKHRHSTDTVAEIYLSKFSNAQDTCSK